MLRAATERGLSPSDMTSAEFQSAALSAMTTAEIARAGMALSMSTVRVKALKQSVPLPVLQERERTCRANLCGKFVELADGEPACLACGCCGSSVREIKWVDPLSKCPLGLWHQHRESAARMPAHA